MDSALGVGVSCVYRSTWRRRNYVGTCECVCMSNTIFVDIVCCRCYAMYSYFRLLFVLLYLQVRFSRNSLESVFVTGHTLELSSVAGHNLELASISTQRGSDATALPSKPKHWEWALSAVNTESLGLPSTIPLTPEQATFAVGQTVDCRSRKLHGSWRVQ